MKSLFKLACLSLVLSSQLSHAFPSLSAHAIKTSNSLVALSIRKVSFSESWSRYPSPDSILATLREDFPYAELSQMLDSSSGAGNGSHCGNLTPENRTVLGESDPISGTPAVDRPNASFVTWYLGCVKEFVVRNDDNLQKLVGEPSGTPENPSLNTSYVARPFAEMRDYFTPAVFADCAIKLPEDGKEFNFGSQTCMWSQVSPASRQIFVKTLIRRYVGPEDVVKELGIAPTEQAYADQLLSEIDDYLQKQDNRYTFLRISSSLPAGPVSNGELFTIREAMKVVQFLIHLQDTLKY